MDRSLPGADLIERGLADLANGNESDESLLVSIGAPRLTALGFVIDDPIPNAERKLYDRLAEEDQDSAHSGSGVPAHSTSTSRSFPNATNCSGRSPG